MSSRNLPVPTCRSKLTPAMEKALLSLFEGRYGAAPWPLSGVHGNTVHALVARGLIRVERSIQHDSFVLSTSAGEIVATLLDERGAA